MVLHHVLERTDTVEVPGAALQGQVLIPGDLNLGDVCAVPGGSEEKVGEPAAEDVLHGGHREEVVDAEHRLFGQEFGEQSVQVYGALQVLAERLLQYDAAAGRELPSMQRGHRDREESGW